MPKASPSKPFAPVSRRVLLALACAAALAPVCGMAQDYPSKPIHIMVGAPPGGSLDLVARLIAPRLAEVLNTTVIVENKSGASGVLNSEYVGRSAPDGYTLMVGSASPVVIAPQTLSTAKFNPTTDLAAINMVATTPQAIAVNPALGVKTLKELLVRARTQQVSLSSNGNGGLPHLTIELLAQASQGKILHVPYKGAGPALNDTIAGHVDGIVMDVPAVYPFVQEGRLVALAVTSEKPVQFMPNVPTASQELPGFAVSNWLGVFAPAHTPQPVIDKLNAALSKVVAREDVRAQFLKAALIPTQMATPAAFQQFVAGEYSRWGKLVKEKGIVNKE